MLHWLSEVNTTTPAVNGRERSMPLFCRNSVALYLARTVGRAIGSYNFIISFVCSFPFLHCTGAEFYLIRRMFNKYCSNVQ